MKIKPFASNQNGDVRYGVGRLVLTAMSDNDVPFLSHLYLALEAGHAVEFPDTMARFELTRNGEAEELVGNDPAETIAPAVDDALTINPDRASETAVSPDDALASGTHDAEGVHG